MKGAKYAGDVAIAAVSLYNPSLAGYKCRMKLAGQFLEKARGLGYDVFVSDGGSDESFLNYMESLGVSFSIGRQEGSLSGPGKRKAILSAYKSGRKVIVLTELEKVNLLDSIDAMAKPILEDGVDIVVAERRSLKEASCPAIQRITEPVGNLVWKICTGRDMDIFFGPRAFSRESSEYFTKYDGPYGDHWEINFIPVMRAIRGGKRVEGRDMDFAYSPEQRHNENGEWFPFLGKRLRQLWNINTAVIKDSIKHHA